MGLTLETTSVILNLHNNEVNNALCLALTDLPRLAGVQTASVTTRNQPDR
ncbi:MAG: hypothetical protein ACJ74Y_11775 [Bryobacteraceae bacterium]